MIQKNLGRWKCIEMYGHVMYELHECYCIQQMLQIVEVGGSVLQTG